MGILDGFKLDGQVALVTGAGSGIGRAIAEAMAEAGADVVCIGRRKHKVDETVEVIRGLGRRGLAISADVSKEADAKRMVEQTVAEFGRLDIVFANAGISGEPEPFLEQPLDSWQEAIDIDLTGVFLTAREAAKVMVPQKRGKIITISSIHGGFVGQQEGRKPGYTAAKGGVAGLTKTLAITLAPHGILVNCIAPGSFRTPIGRGIFMKKELDEETKRIQETFLRFIPLGRPAEPAEMKGLALLLASPASDYITGAVIPIDGGWSAW